MSNKHGLGPRCPLCPRYFRDAGALEAHQRAKGHFADRLTAEAIEEKRAAGKLRAYHAERKAAQQ